MDELQKHLSTFDISLTNVIQTVDFAMKLVGTMKGLTGADKKRLVLDLLLKKIAESPIKTSEKEILQLIVETMADPLIEKLFSLAPQVYGKVVSKCCF